VDLDWQSISLLVCFTVLAVLWFALKDKRKHISTAVLVVVTAFVASNLNSHVIKSGRLTNTPSVMDADRAELMLRLSSVIKLMERYLPQGKITTKNNEPTDVKLAHDALSVLVKLADKERQNERIAAKLVVASQAAHEPIGPPIAHLSHIDSNEARELSKILAGIYESNHLDVRLAVGWEPEIKRLMDPGWYRESVLLNLYSVSGQKKEFTELQNQIEDRSLLFCYKLVGVLLAIVLACLLGAIVILVQLFFLPRKVTPAKEEWMVRSPIKYSPKLIYGVFIGWMATQMLVGLIAQLLLKDHKLTSLGSEGRVLTAAVGTALIYFISNAPGVAYAYFFALKPNSITFFEGFRLRAKMGKLGPFRLALAGFLTWLAAVPIVALSYALAVRFLNSQGSSNPIIALVMEAARSSNISATFVFYLTLGVLAPLCEETLFRGFLYSAFRSYWGVVPSMMLSAALFAGVHLDVGGFLPLFSLGCLFAFVFERTKSIVPSMVAHGLWNSGTFTLVLTLFGG